ncbi:hypothetical protein [Citricoccus muralis]|uniref:Uncharacterized protein n=1 Tax=Citricoccus muralis TaxID=169134 RepID=A0ABY8H4J9_9MICC|nr:hypothetical protein [Citricoccus muralis]WFP16020.1 hypothetical protein P8192_11550 [Citricoccus muralis]
MPAIVNITAIALYMIFSGKAERPALAAQPAGGEGTEDDADQTRV